MAEYNVGSKKVRQTANLPLNPAEKDVYLLCCTGVEEATSKSSNNYFKLKLAFFHEDGTEAVKVDGSGEQVVLEYACGVTWPSWDAVASAFFPELDDEGGTLDLPSDFGERWAMGKIAIEEPKEGSKFLPRLKIDQVMVVPDTFLDVIAEVSEKLTGRVSTTVEKIRGLGKKATASKPAAGAQKPASTASKPAAGAQKPASTASKPAAGAQKPASTAAKPATKPASKTATATATQEVDGDDPFGGE